MFDNLWAWGAGAFAVVAGGGIIAGIYVLGGAVFLSAITKTWIGRVAVGVGAAVLVGLVIAAKVFASGQARERLKQQQASIKAATTRKEKDDEISGLSDADRRKRIGVWVRD